MEGIPQIISRSETVRRVSVPFYARDHHSGGQVLFPAVEIIDLLASQVKESLAGIDIMAMSLARFDRFIRIGQNVDAFDAIIALEQQGGDAVKATLMTRTVLKSGMSRKIEHASMVFGTTGENFRPMPLDLACSLQGRIFEVAAEDMYRDLVPFGPAFRNVTGALYLSAEGAMGTVSGGDVSRSWALGSPFALDAAFHAACAWSQRYAGIVAFPVAFASRVIHSPALAGEELFCRVLPAGQRDGSLFFDLSLMRSDGGPCETVAGLEMRDVSSGRARPPRWISEGTDDERLPELEQRCRGFAVMERRALAPFAKLALSPAEEDRHRGMGERRSEGFIAARLCCKRLSRFLSGSDLVAPPQEITTIDEDPVKPRCPSTSGDRVFPCSVSHDSRFALALASGSRVGVDVERLADRVLKGQRFYMSEKEQRLAAESFLGPVAACLRVWSIKECIAKAFDLKLYQAWKKGEVTRIGESSSSVVIDEREHAAFHGSIDDHVFTVLHIE